MMTIKLSKAIVLSVVVAITISACNTGTGVNNEDHADSSSITVYTFQVQHGYGYAIFINDKEFINQDCIPVIQGNKTFASKQQARQTGELVAQKIRAKQLPALTLEELNKLGITQQ